MTRTETISVANVDEVMDEELVHVVTLNTTGDTHNREELYEAVYNAGVNPDDLHEHENDDIGTVEYDENGEIVNVTLEDWVLEKYGF